MPEGITFNGRGVTIPWHRVGTAEIDLVKVVDAVRKAMAAQR